MTVTELLKKKNKIIRDEYGINFDLVPKSQIVEVEPKLLSTADDTKACIYCLHFFNDKCNGCPMSENGNKCLDGNSTYMKIFKDRYNESFSQNEKVKKRLDELFHEFNESNGLI